MASQDLTPEQHDEIFYQMKRIFSDFHLLDKLVASNLKTAIQESNNIEINHLTTKKVVERYYDVQSFTSPEQKLLLSQISLIFKACYVLILTYHDGPKQFMWQSVDKLLEAYPEFQGVEDEELQLLLKFRNMLRITLLLIPARLNKSIILKVAGRLEGSQNEYITGGGQKKEVQRRVKIYEQEGGVTAEKRPDRKRKKADDEGSANNSKRTDANFTYKKVKQVRLPSEEVRELSKPANPLAKVPPSIINRMEASHDIAPTSGALSALSNVAVEVARAEAANTSRIIFSNMPSSAAMAPPRMPMQQFNPDDISRPLPMGDLPVDLSRGWSLGAISLPSLSRETSDVLDKYINESDFWSENMQDIRQPATMARNISMSVYDGSFREALKSLGDFNLPK